jgi:hypothetical protein
MYIVVIAWAYVVLMMVVAEATSANGTVLGAFFTALLYGVIPISIVVYLMRAPARRAKRRALEIAQAQALDQAPLGRPRSPETPDQK